MGCHPNAIARVNLLDKDQSEELTFMTAEASQLEMLSSHECTLVKTVMDLKF
jgi:hypothetical protein